MKTFRIGLVAVGLGLVLAGGGPLTSGQAAPKAIPDSQLDVEIAVDGTGSMASAIAQVKTSGVGLTEGVVKLLPNTRFAVVVFRDRGNPAGEYQVLQPFTADRNKVHAGLNRITAAFNRDPNNTDAESYNLAFRKSYSDPQLAWRPSARKIVLVLGDAEPNGAGTDRLPGCRDHSRDPENLSTTRELANMRAAGRTLVMVRELSHELSVSLRCYQSIAARAYVGGVARDGGSNLVSTMVELVQGAFAPLTLKPDLMTVLRANRSGYTLKVQNPNLLPLTVKSVRVVLPQGFRYVRRTTTGMTRGEPTVSGRTLVWSLTKVVGAGRQASLHLRARTPRRLGTYRSTATGFVETAAGNQLTPRTPSVKLRVKKRISAIAFHIHATGGTPRISGGVSARLRGHGTASRAVPARGWIVVRTGHGRRLLLRVRKLRLQRLTDPTRARLTLHVASARGLRGCHGSRATLLLVYSTALRSDEIGASSVKLSLPRACGGTLRRSVEVTASDR